MLVKQLCITLLVLLSVILVGCPQRDRMGKDDALRLDEFIAKWQAAQTVFSGAPAAPSAGNFTPATPTIQTELADGLFTRRLPGPH